VISKFSTPTKRDFLGRFVGRILSNMSNLRESGPSLAILALIAFESSALAVSVFFPYVNPELSSFNMRVYSFLSPLSIVPLLGLLYSWVVILVARFSSRRWKSFGSFLQFLSIPFRDTVLWVRSVSLSDSSRSFKILGSPKLLLVIGLFMCCVLAAFPYRPDLNPSGTVVGIDSSTYATWVAQMTARPVPSALQYSFVEGLDGSRPLLLISLYLVASIGVSPHLTVEYLPIVLAPLLSLSSYIFVRFGQGSANLAGLSALFTPPPLLKYCCRGMGTNRHLPQFSATCSN